MPTPGNEERTASVPISSTANLVLTQSIAPSPPQAGGSATVRPTVTNNGPSHADNVVITVTIPPGVNLVSASGGCSLGGGRVNCAPGPPGVGCLGDRPDRLRARRSRGGLTGDGGGDRALLHPRPQRREQRGGADLHGRCGHGRREHPQVGQSQPGAGGWDGDLLDGGDQRRSFRCPRPRGDRSAACRAAPGRRPGAGFVRAARPDGHLQRGHPRSRCQRHGLDQRGGAVERAAWSARRTASRCSPRRPTGTPATTRLRSPCRSVAAPATGRTTGTTRPRSTVAPAEASQTTTTLPGELPATGSQGAPLGAASILLAIGVVFVAGAYRGRRA